MSRLQLYRCMRRRWRGPRLVAILSVFAIGYLSTIFVVANMAQSTRPDYQHGNSIQLDQRSMHRKLLEQSQTQVPNSATTPRPGEYPPAVFSREDLRRKGAVIFYILGMMYMFVALAIVCDEFFVPALEVIIEKYSISDDVAGATFMAAGGSAPELFTSFIGVFIAYSNVGIGTIVGSAVFNILFVIGMCAIFSKGVLQLTWWPLFRDVSFYSISLICLILFYQDEHIYWWEALLLLLCYVAYVIFMKFNADIESWVKSKIQRNRVTTVRSTDNLINADAAAKMAAQNGSLPALKGSHKFRHGLLQLMIHTIDPLGEAKVHDKALKLHAVASLKVLENMENHNGPPNQPNKNGAIPAISNGQLMDGTPRNASMTPVGRADEDEQTDVTTRHVVMAAENGEKTTGVAAAAAATDDAGDDRSQAETATTVVSSTASAVSIHPDQPVLPNPIENENEPLDLSWPKTWRKRITYILVAPLLFPMYITLPDTRRPSMRKFYPWTFLGSILWIIVFSYLMTWWATVTGEAIGIPIEVMGLTFLAAGTSVPDLITSVIVAKKGFGDMAVSSSVGSNIFDVTVGLPVPWLLYGIIFGEPYSVSSRGLFCSIILLFLMLLLVIITIAALKWKMNKIMGIAMFVFYLVFVAISLLLEYTILPCPVS